MAHSNIAIFVPHKGCPHRCSFCNQHIISGSTTPTTPEDVTRICSEARCTVSDKANTEIAFFGGSFTAIPRDEMTALLKAAQPFLGEDGFCGIRISTRPDCIDESVLSVLKTYGVTSIELGAQSMSDRVLAMNERGHTAEDVARASVLIRSYGFSLGLQMMVGLYGASSQDDSDTADALIRLHPDTVRIYPTVILRQTRLERLYADGTYQPISMEAAAQICADLLDRFESNGISVIRCGLHASDGVEEEMVGGLYHPAFRELCDTLRYRQLIDQKLAAQRRPGSATVLVHPSCVGKAAGHKKSNLHYFAQRGITLRIRPQEGIPRFACKLTF